MKRDGDLIINEIAHRDGDYIYLDSDGIKNLRMLLGLARLRRSKTLEGEATSEGGWNFMLLFTDKILTSIFQDATEIRIKLPLAAWAPIEKELNAHLKRMNR